MTWRLDFPDQLLRYTLAVVLGWEAIQTLLKLPAHVPHIVVLLLAGMVLLGCLLLALPKLAYTGGWVLLLTLVAAIAIHLAQHMGYESLLVYAAATFAVTTKLRS